MSTAENTAKSLQTEAVILNKTIRNIAIIAHVDHGKTTLVDSMFRQSGILRDNEQLAERAMDSHDLERERGITILAKNTAIPYNDYKINILDTPGHADFSGEVERVLTMVDGALLVVDAVEGPMPQTRFVLRKALEQGLKIILVINKIDRDAANPARAIDKVVDLFIELGADEGQLDFPVVYASGLAGQSALSQEIALSGEMTDLTPLMETIVSSIQAPPGDDSAPLQLQVSTLDYNDYLGRIVIGRISRGCVSTGQTIALVQRDGKISQHRVNKLFGFQGLKRIDISSASAGDIVAVAGIPEVQIGETLADLTNPEGLPLIDIEEPTLKMTFSINTSPMAGREGKYVTSRQLRDRLWKEVKSNISLRVEEGDSPDNFIVSGRGELHLTILIETMRREGFEFQVSKPEVLTKTIDGQIHEPSEDLVLDVPEDVGGSCIEQLCQRKGELRNMETLGARTTITFVIPSRGLLGFRSEFIRMTRGQGMMAHTFSRFIPWVGDIGSNRSGVLVANEAGEATAYAIKNAEDRGVFFITPRTVVYRGMIIGENSRGQDLVLNITKAKKLTNMRSAGADVLDVLQTPIALTLEFGLDYIAADELMEVTPENIRLRKANLDFKR